MSVPAVCGDARELVHVAVAERRDALEVALDDAASKSLKAVNL